MTILGSLILHADRPPAELPVPEIRGLTRREGRHVGGRYNGSFTEFFDATPLEVLLPQRYKRMSLLADVQMVRHDLAEELATLDSRYGDARQLYKLNRLQQSMRRWSTDYTAVVNVVNSGADQNVQSGAFYLFASGEPIHMSVLMDSLTGAVQLVWSTFDHVRSLREAKALNYAVYQMPTLIDRPLFIPSLTLCSKWWRLNQKLNESKYGAVKALNALELILYKDPDLQTLNHELR